MKEKEFEILRLIAESRESLTQRVIAAKTGYSLGTVNAIVSDLMSNDMINQNYRITSTGLSRLEPYKVDNAIILAAGMSTRFVPISYELPKGLITVKNEVMIERLIVQLQEAGISDIVLVLGYMMDKFFYLREKYGVKFVVNNEYTIKNTHSSIFAARDYLSNTYILCSDNYYPDNMFHKYEYRAYYCGIYLEEKCYTERGFICADDQLVIGTSKPTEKQWIMYGHAYLSKSFSDDYKPILEQYYNRPGIENMYWETIYAENVDKLHLWLKKCKGSEILEFDSIKELEQFDPDYITYNKIKIFQNICEVLSCKYSDISGITPITQGLTNKSFKFTCNGKDYIYRHPGANSNGIVDRKKERKSLKIAEELKIDETLVFINKSEGWKISKFIDVTEEFDFNNKKHIQLLSNHLKTLHQSKQCVGFDFDYKKEAEKIMKKERFIDALSYQQLKAIQGKMEPIFQWLEQNKWQKSFCHNDIYSPNLLISGNTLSIIDWEFAGDNDIGYDICKLFATQNVPYDEIDEWLCYYYGRKTTEEEKLHLLACAAVIYYYWYIWSIFAIRNNSDVSEYMISWYKKMNDYSDEVLRRI